MVKRVGHLMEQICRSDNLSEAFLRAAKGKSCKREVRLFRQDLSLELASMARDLSDGSYRFAPYREFTIYDPKKRQICAAAFRDRVAFHSMMRVCHQVFDNYQIYDSYASRIGKGVYAALERAEQFCRKNTWFVKLDIVRYFDNIDQEVMMSQLCRLFKDPRLLQIFQRLLNTYETSCKRGLPIGNLTSQYFANHYLSIADHYCKENMGVKYMIRYMDDLIMFSNDKKQLLEWCEEYRRFISEHLHLKLHPVILNQTRYGIPFLGYVVYGDHLRLNTVSRRRFRKRMESRQMDCRYGIISEKKYSERVRPLYAFIEKADVKAFKNKIMKDGLFP